MVDDTGWTVAWYRESATFFFRDRDLAMRFKLRWG